MTSVKVICPIGQSTFPRADVEIKDDVLTVNWVDIVMPYRIAQTFQPGTWLEYTVNDEHGVSVKTGMSALGQRLAAEKTGVRSGRELL